jgi:ribosome-associated protein
MSASSSRHARALADAVLERSTSARTPEGYALGEWILVDLGDVVVHVFNGPQRMYYNFDRLWGHAVGISPEQAQVRPPKLEQRSRHPA